MVWRARERAREGLPGAAIGPSAVMPGAEKPARRPLMEAGALKLRVVVSTPSPGTAVRPLPLELSINFHLYMGLGHLSSAIAELCAGKERKSSHCITYLSEFKKTSDTIVASANIKYLRAMYLMRCTNSDY